MSFIISWCFNTHSAYDALKKNDDYGVREARSWKIAYPLEQARAVKYEKVGAYAHAVIAGLKTVPLTAASGKMVGDHLIAMAQASARMRNLLFTEFTALRDSQHFKGDPEIVTDLADRLIGLS